MKIKAGEISIPSGDPFKEDALGRKIYAENLTTLVKSLSEPFVLSIDGSWGSGKTVFIKMWQQMLNDSGINTIYFNAWENDIYADPFLSFVNEIEKKINEISKRRDSKISKKFDKLKMAGTKLIKISLPTLVKLGSSGILNFDSFSEETLPTFFESIAKNKIEEFAERKKSLGSFRTRLIELTQEMPATGNDTQIKLVFFIDELDRCRPNYAVELLENIKHIFNVEGIVFVLAVDRFQLSQSVKAMFGSSMESDGYFRRFIDLDFKLPLPDYKQFCKHLMNYYDFPNMMSQRSLYNYDTDQLINTFSSLAKLFKFSLRTQEQCFTQFSVAFRVTPSNFKIYSPFLALLVALRSGNYELYKKYGFEEGNPDDLLAFFESKEEGIDFLNTHYGNIIEAHVITGFIRSFSKVQEIVKAYEEKSSKQDINDQQKERYQNIASLLKNIRERDMFGVAKYLIDKIEFAQRFEASNV